MTVRTLFPRLLVVGFALCLTAGVAAQSSEDSRQTSITTDSNGSRQLGTDLSVPPLGEERRSRLVGASALAGRFDQRLLGAIQSHLGSPYYYTGTGPNAFDCSGFVWRTFQEAGFDFSRGPARSYWASFAPATKEEESQFGTLVFFSGLAHVGIVGDEHGFYHASRHHGVIYSPFDKYWLSRIDGFRRVPLNSLPKSVLNQKAARVTKPVTSTQGVEEDNEP